MSEEKEPFVARWSRLKTEAREAPKEGKPAEPAPPPSPAGGAGGASGVAAPPAPILPPVEQLTPESDFAPFMDPKVDDATRRAALKKLFADARFNVPDPFEAYSEDYTKGEPIPLEMLKTLNQARRLLFEETEKSAQAKAGKPEPAPRDAKDGARRQDA
jgi:hypothetical protein